MAHSDQATAWSFPLIQVAERAGSDADVMGTRAPFWPRSDIERMDAMSRWFTVTCRRPNKFLDNRKDALYLDMAA